MECDGINIEECEKSNIKEAEDDLIYHINDTPPWYMCIILGFQHFLTMFSGTVSVPLIMTSSLCLGNYLIRQTEIISTSFFVMGIATLLQTTFGTRLPIIQGASASFILPALSILSLPQYKCPTSNTSTIQYFSNVSSNSTSHFEEPWRERIMVVSGTIAVASLFQFLIGATGLITLLLRYLGPLVICPTISLIGISLFPAALPYCAKQWWIALLTCCIIIVCSNYIHNINLPILVYNKNNKWHFIWFPVFKTFPVIIGICTTWIICLILTISGALPSEKDAWGYYARTDIRFDVLRDSAWIKFPYPAQFGIPTVYAPGLLGMISGVLASVVESVGDYMAAAKLCKAPPPPAYAINRGIIMEGIGCLVAGLWGVGVGTTSYSENIGALAITKVGSRRVVQVAGIIMIVMGLFNKIGALFVSLPDPIIGGVFLAMFSMVAGVGFANLQYADLNSSRNLFIVGFSIFSGLALPYWFRNNGNVFNFGVVWLEETLMVLLTTNMFVGGFIAFFLDNTMPGSLEERGLLKLRELDLNETSDERKIRKTNLLSTYDLPIFYRFFRFKIFDKAPFCPTYSNTLTDIINDDESSKL